MIFKTFQNLGCYKPTTLKRNLVPRFGEARKKDRFATSGFRQLGGLPPLKETFVGSLGLSSSDWGPSGYLRILVSWNSFPTGGCLFTSLLGIDRGCLSLSLPKVQDERISQRHVIPLWFVIGMLFLLVLFLQC